MDYKLEKCLKIAALSVGITLIVYLILGSVLIFTIYGGTKTVMEKADFQALMNDFTTQLSGCYDTFVMSDSAEYREKQEVRHVFSLNIFHLTIRIFSVCAPLLLPSPPPPPHPVHFAPPALQSTCHYIASHYVKIARASGGASNMRPLSWGGGGGAQTEEIRRFSKGRETKWNEAPIGAISRMAFFWIES